MGSWLDNGSNLQRSEIIVYTIVLNEGDAGFNGNYTPHDGILLHFIRWFILVLKKQK